MSSSLGCTQAIQGARLEPHVLSHTDPGPLCIEPEGLACHPVSKQIKPGRRQSGFAIPGLQGTCQTRNRMQNFSPGGGHIETQENYQSSPPPCQQAGCPHSGAQGHQRLSSSRFPQGPAARPAHCAKATRFSLTPPWPGVWTQGCCCTVWARVRANSGHQLPHSAALP